MSAGLEQATTVSKASQGTNDNDKDLTYVEHPLVGVNDHPRCLKSEEKTTTSHGKNPDKKILSIGNIKWFALLCLCLWLIFTVVNKVK